MGNAPLGSYLGYQLFDSKKSLTVNVDRPVEKMVENQGTRIEPFPDLPIRTNCTFPNSWCISKNDVIKNITVKIAQCQQIEKNNWSKLLLWHG